MATKSFNRRFHGRCGGKFSFFRNPFVFVILWLVVAAGIGAIVMLLWNWLMPVIFGLPALSLWQALGLLVLMRILFGSFGLDGCRRLRAYVVHDSIHAFHLIDNLVGNFGEEH